MTDHLDDRGDLDLLRAANPVSATTGPWRDRPLDHVAERGLNQLLHRTRARRARRRVVLWAEAAAVALAAVFALTMPDLAAAPATAAAPGALHPRDDAAVTLDRLADRAESAARDGGPRLRAGAHVQTWSLAMDEGPDADRPVTLPEEREVRWRPDGSRTERVEADGKFLSERVFPPSRSDAPPRARPPHTAAALRAYLTEVHDPGFPRRTTPAGTQELLDALPSLLDTWTLGARESAALARLLADSGGLRPAGTVTDRLGRSGQAYVHESRDEHLRYMLILDPDTGEALGLEVLFTKDQPRFAVEAGDVMSYSAWRR
ncbi:CU044_5270 family protein [Streptomyces flavofungini]|uniref:CU044_5270 family protein n=1 Tax=Streptomyces flavofungini TaxID=68200 RepID=UPI001E60A981|nr:CU044_5270 family protein [Streptomyces flavofungini]